MGQKERKIFITSLVSPSFGLPICKINLMRNLEAVLLGVIILIS